MKSIYHRTLLAMLMALTPSCASRRQAEPETKAIALEPARMVLPDIPPLPPGMDGAKTPDPKPRPRARPSSAAPRLADIAPAPDYVVLSRIDISDGTNTLSAELKGRPYPYVQADSKSAVVIFPMRGSNYVLRATADFGGFTNAEQVAKGAVLGTNSALIFIDMHGGAAPVQFFWLTETP